MIHPDTELRFVNPEKGRGVFATNFIPRGTLTYVQDRLEILIPPGDPRLNDPAYIDLIETYSFIDSNGVRIISWDHAKYVNHCCRCNTMSTGYGFEIAIRDIAEGEEITDEYGMFNFTYSMELSCENTPCRNVISGSDILTYHEEWDRVVAEALQQYLLVDQPLASFMDTDVQNELIEFLKTGKNYRSVKELIPVRHRSYILKNGDAHPAAVSTPDGGTGTPSQTDR
jgi:uncharacterized protein